MPLFLTRYGKNIFMPEQKMLSQKKQLPRKHKIINRIMTFTQMYTHEYLSQFSDEQLKFLQKTILIPMWIRLKFKFRTPKNHK